jgi:hypothetical protein
MALAPILRGSENKIRRYLRCSDAQWNKMARLVESREELGRPFDAEEIWTFLIGCAYAMGGEAGVATLTGVLTGAQQLGPYQPCIWFEAMPTEPRVKEGKTHVDLAVGSIHGRTATNSGIELELRGPSWVCFAEAKWKTDIQSGVTYDPQRNQLARVIENALCFQKLKCYANTVYVSVIAPEAFVWDHSLAKRKFDEYADRKNLVRDLVECRLATHNASDWRYPDDISCRVQTALQLTWVTHEKLLAQLPNTEMRAPLSEGWQREPLRSLR